MRIKLLLIIAFVLFQTLSNAQEVQNTERKSFWKSTWRSIEVGYGKSFKNDYSQYKYNMYSMSFRAKTGYYLTPQFSLGIGVGLNEYRNYPTTPALFMVDIRYHPIKILPNLYTYADIGGSFYKISLTSGFLSDIGLGYKIRLGKRVSLNPAVMYSFFSSSSGTYNYDDTERVKRHTIFLQLGIHF
jgi:hypothetical protein